MRRPLRALPVGLVDGAGDPVDPVVWVDPAAGVVMTGGAFLSDKALVRVEEEALVQLERESR